MCVELGGTPHPQFPVMIWAFRIGQNDSTLDSFTSTLPLYVDSQDLSIKVITIWGLKNASIY